MSSRPPPQFKSVVTLIPHSGVQFMDFALSVGGPNKISRSFTEEVAADGAKILLALTGEGGAAIHPITQAAVDPEATYAINAARALEPFVGVWTPIPFMRLLGRDATGRDVFDEGPSNWARCYLAPGEDGEAGVTHRLVLAFDTDLDPKPRSEQRAYAAPTLDDARAGETFCFSALDDDIAWFVGAPWVDEWLSELFMDLQRRKSRNRRFRPEDLQHELEHVACYMTFLSFIEQTCRFPRIRLVDTISSELDYAPIHVDLVIDVGNSRTCGILIESDPDDSDRLDLNKSYVLSLRDLSQPQNVHAQAFESRVEFARPSFGSEAISRRSGRGNAFLWPSLTRIGPEAARLSVSGAGTEGATGLSSPKRYIWDRRPLNQVWRFRSTGADGADRPETQVSGPVLAFVTEDGDVLRRLKRPASPAIRPKFSRSSLFTFFMAEVILQAMASINSVESRGRQRNSDIPRQLRQIIMTVPPATPIAERRILRERVDGAVTLAWQALGWTEKRSHPAPPEPKVQIAFDEATCTQIVYLFSEITQKLQRPAADFFALMGRKRGSDPNAQPSLRIASVDIGGGTTDLMIITYEAQNRRAIVPTQLFREGFKLAGDDILEAVVARHVLPAIESQLANCGLAEAHGFLRGVVGADRGGQSEQERQFRRRFVTELAVPAALRILHEYENAKLFSEEPPRSFSLGDIAASASEASSVPAEFDRLAAAAGARNFRLAETLLEFRVDDLSATIQSVIGPVLSDLAEVIHALDCDVVLISGRPSRFPIVLDLLLSRLPTRPDRIIPMHQYRVGKWYPFRDAHDRVDDPKTTVAVGALLCTLATEAQIEGFVLSGGRFSIASTARYVGEMDLSGVVRNESLLFADIDLDGKPRREEEARVLKIFPPTTIGYRQLPLERWPATPLYMIEFANVGHIARARLPLSVAISRETDEPNGAANREDFKIVEVEDADGTALRASDLVLRLQTLKSASGYWLDTGIVDSY